MPVTAREAVAVIDFHHVAVTALASGDRYTARGRRADRLSRVAAQVDAGVDRGPAQEWVHAHAERRTHVDFTDDRLAYWHRDQSMRVTIDLRAGDVHPIKLALEGAGACLRRLDRNEGPADRPVTARFDRIDSEIREHAPHAACLRIDALLKICERRSLRLLDFVQR